MAETPEEFFYEDNYDDRLYLLTTTYINVLIDSVIIDAPDMETAQRIAKEEADLEWIISRAKKNTSSHYHEQLDQLNPDKFLWREHEDEGWELTDRDDTLGGFGWTIHLQRPRLLRAT